TKPHGSQSPKDSHLLGCLDVNHGASERIHDAVCDLPREQRRDGVSYLAKSGVHCPREDKSIGKGLKPSRLTDCYHARLRTVVVDMGVGVLANVGRERPYG